MRESHVSDRNPKKACVWLTAVVLVFGMTSAGCSFNNHLTFGATEKWVASDIHTIPKIGGTVLLSVFDSILSPWFMIGDEFRSERYHPDHKYLSYAGSRAIGRSGMPLGYQMIASIFSIPIETAYLPITGLIDLVRIVFVEDVPVPASANGGKPKAGF